MITTNPLFISSRGGSITCFKGDSGRIFRSCSRSRDDLEKKTILLAGAKEKIPAQRKTTLKWSIDGELSAVDMARILDRLANPELTECNLACNVDDHSSTYQGMESFQRLPSSS